MSGSGQAGATGRSARSRLPGWAGRHTCSGCRSGPKDRLMLRSPCDRINIAEVVGVQVISLDQAPQGYGEFDEGVLKKFVIDPHKTFSAA